ncbi:MAG: hypothetical protein JWO33_2664 [Caulobacteraceae bacterium]|nr:hypothetical protein [Caulobacteraceae bacterium]
MKSFVLVLLTGASLLATAAHAEAAAEAADAPISTVEQVIVFGRAEQRIGKAVAATEGALAGADLTARPILRTAEILEAVPGMIVTQHSGSGKANQYFLRGFNLDHGTDFGLTIDGVPMNFRTHGHGPGYLDLNGLIPETVERIDYRKGPYRADLGDFNLVGGGIISTKSTFDRPFLLAEYGAFDWKRLVAGGSFEVLGGEVLLAGMAKTYDGPWAKPEGTKAFSSYGKYSRMTGMGQVSLSLATYQSTWDPTEQIADRAIGTLIPDAFGSLDPFMHGRTRREIASLQLDGEAWRGSLYAQHYDWRMNSNSTYFLDDPVNGDEFEQAERLWTYGGRLERHIAFGEAVSVILGGEGRYDDIGDVALYHTVQGHRIGTTAKFAVEEASAALYAEAVWRPVEKLSISGGLRGDAYHFRTRPLGGDSWAGSASDSIVLPKAGVSYQIADGVAVYANWGEGFHSNDARAVTNPDTPAPGLIRGTGQEVGARYERHGLVATAAYWWMDNKSELIFSGDANTVEPAGASERHGYELTAFWRPLPGLAVDGMWTWTHARFKDSPEAAFIPGGLKNTGEVGVTYIRPAWNASGRVRYMGRHPLTEDNLHVSDPTTIVNLRAAWTPRRYEVFAELLNVFDSKAKDIEYWYESYLPQIDLNGPVEAQHSRAVEPRMVRAGVRVNF